MIRPALELAQEPATAPSQYLAVGGLAVFIGAYFWAGPLTLMRRVRGRPGLAAAVLASLAFVIALGERDANWTILFVAAAVVAGAIMSSRRAIAALIPIAALATLARGVATGTPVGMVEASFGVLISGLVVVSFRKLDRTTHELSLANAEVARLSAADERARIARDVHDLLGHSLSVIALKSELARRLVDDDPARASGELQDIEGVARGLLRDIRATVAGYRLITLETELAGARVALSAAGIQVEVHQTADVLDRAADALLGWVVREGITNVIRHSDSAHCTIRIESVQQNLALEIVDDGRGNDQHRSGAPGPPGSGLSGILERVQAAGGRFESGPLPGRGYRLAVVVPDLAGPPASASTVAERDQDQGRGATHPRAEESEPSADASGASPRGPE